jgi:hypothetical protein
MGGRVFDSEGIKIEGVREKGRGRRRKRRREGTFTIHIYSLFCEEFVVHNLNNLLMALNMRHTLFAYSLYILELLEHDL